jgi:prolyl 4-hydroxylase
MKVSAVGGAENVNIRTSRTVTLDVASLKDHPTKKAILRAAELLLPQLAGLAASKSAFKSPTSTSPFSFELPQVAHYGGGGLYSQLFESSC